MDSGSSRRTREPGRAAGAVTRQAAFSRPLPRRTLGAVAVAGRGGSGCSISGPASSQLTSSSKPAGAGRQGGIDPPRRTAVGQRVPSRLLGLEEHGLHRQLDAVARQARRRAGSAVQLEPQDVAGERLGAAGQHVARPAARRLPVLPDTLHDALPAPVAGGVEPVANALLLLQLNGQRRITWPPAGRGRLQKMAPGRAGIAVGGLRGGDGERGAGHRLDLGRRDLRRARLARASGGAASGRP